MTSLRHNLEDSRDSKDVYLDAARDCILDVGWRRTTLTEVAKRAGVSRMTIYRTWSDMQTLLGDLMTREWAGTVAAQVEARHGGSGRDRLVDGMVSTVRTLRQNELFARIVEVDPELILPYLFDRRGRSQDLVLGLLESGILDGQGDGSIRAGRPVVLARATVLALHGFVLSFHTMSDSEVSDADLDTELASLIERFLAP